MAKANRANGSRGFPKEIKLPNGAAITLRLMEHSDKEKILAFARSLPQDDLLFLRTDITEPASIEEWIRNVEQGDTATVVAVLLVAAARTFIMLAMAGAGIGDGVAFLRITLLDLVGLVLRVYLFAMLLYWLTSMVSPGGYAPGVRLLAQVCEPILKPVRRVIPRIGQIDFSVLWVSIGIGALLVLLR